MAVAGGRSDNVFIVWYITMLTEFFFGGGGRMEGGGVTPYGVAGPKIATIHNRQKYKSSRTPYTPS
jgi:hypothetical protein